METNAFLKALFEGARREGLKDFEAMMVSGESFSVTTHEGKVHTLEMAGEIDFGFRALIDGKMGIASTQVLDEDAIAQLIAGVKTNAALVDGADRQFLYDGKDACKTPPACETNDPMSASEKIDLALSLEKAALCADPKIAQIEDCGAFTGTSLRRIVGSSGLDVSFSRASAGLYVCPVARDRDKVNAAMKFGYGKTLSGMDIPKIAQSAAAEAVFGLYGAPIPSGEYPVVFRYDAASSLLSAFSSVFSADAAQRGLSLFAGREGEIVAAPFVTILDDPFLPGGRANAPFDGEGVPTRKKAVVENGRLTTLLHNLKTAAKAGVATTGNASRLGCASPVGVAPGNFFIAPGESDLDGLLVKLGDGLLVTEITGLHAGADAVSGDFSLSAKGCLVHKGKRGAAVSGVTVSGNFYAWLKDIHEAGGDLWFDLPGGACFGSPSILCGKMSVAGR